MLGMLLQRGFQPMGGQLAMDVRRGPRGDGIGRLPVCLGWRPGRQVGEQGGAGIAARLGEEFVPPVQQFGQREVVARGWRAARC